MIDYYKIARESSLTIGKHPGLNYLYHLCGNTKKILDVGCGEGSRLNTLLPQTTSGYGVDINTRAIKLAKKQYPRHHFIEASAEKIPYPANTFDLVYSAFVLEHTTDPEQFVSEMIRVCRSHGKITILCPNFGAPNRRSPVSTQSRMAKLFYGLLADFSHNSIASWVKVTPRSVYNQIDDDTTVEPYITSLITFLREHKCRIEKFSSEWELEPWSLNPRKFLLKLLGTIRIYPFAAWGPQIFVTAEKL